MADRNVWDPQTPPHYMEHVQRGLVVELYIYRFGLSSKDDKQIRADVEGAGQIWCQANINVQAVYLDKLAKQRPSEPLNLNSPDLARDFACGAMPDAVRNQFFNIQRLGDPDLTKSIAVYYIPGEQMQDGATGCHQFRFQGIDGKPEHIILLTDNANGKVLAHELGHALFTRSVGSGQWINHDPDPNADASKLHNTDPRNLMFPSVPDNPVITPPQSSQAKQCALTHDQGLVFGFKEDQPLKLGVKITTLDVKDSWDELTSDDELESSWTFSVNVAPKNAPAPPTMVHTFNRDPLEIQVHTLNLDFPNLDILSDDDELKVSMRGTDSDFGPDDVVVDVVEQWNKQKENWGAGGATISLGQNKDHDVEIKNDEIDCKITYNIRVDHVPAEIIFRNVC